MGLKACLWNEDIDLTGGSAAVAAALSAGVRGGFVLDGTDSILAPNHSDMHIVGVLSGTETASIEGGTLTIDGFTRSPITLGGTNTVPLQVFKSLGLWIPVAARADLDFLGFDHGAACQEFCSVIIDDPAMADVWGISPGVTPQSCDFTMPFGMTSAALVANTQSGHTDICGRTVAYTDGQTAIPNRPGIDIYVFEIESRDIAGSSGCGLESPDGEANLDFPTLATVTTTYNMTEMFGGPLHCTSQDPFNLYGFGAGTTALAEVTMILGLKGLPP